jgi:hypothetical protein
MQPAGIEPAGDPVLGAHSIRLQIILSRPRIYIILVFHGE